MARKYWIDGEEVESADGWPMLLLVLGCFAFWVIPIVVGWRILR